MCFTTQRIRLDRVFHLQNIGEYQCRGLTTEFHLQSWFSDPAQTSHHFSQVPHLVFAVFDLPPAVVDLLQEQESQLDGTAAAETFSGGQRTDSRLVCGAPLAAGVETPSGSSSPSSLSSAKSRCGATRAAGVERPTC